MKKKLLFFGYTLDMGGAEKVMIDFLNVLKDHYEIDIALLKKQGVFLSSVPDGVNITEIRKGLISYILFRYVPFFRKLKINKIANSKDFDVAIGFFEGRSATWVADIRKNIKKIAWVHTDVAHFDIGISDKEAITSYSQMDKIVFVSEEAKKSFEKKYNIRPENLEVLYNLIDEKKILTQAEEIVEPNNKFTFINVGRMSPPKRQDRLIQIAKRLKDDGLQFKIQIIGDGSEKERITKMIEDLDVSEVVELLGLKTNPYPYVKQADCFVLTSDFEGFGIAVKESLLLGTPVISTNVTGVREVLKDGKYGILCDVDTEQIYNAMRSILLTQSILYDFNEKLKEFDCSNSSIVNKLFSIIERD